jgi:hypothetical protein
MLRCQELYTDSGVFLQQDAGIAGLNSKTHMKILLKWMTGRNIVKLTCVHVGNAKKFLYSPFTESSAEALSAETSNKASAQGGRGQPKKQAAARDFAVALWVEVEQEGEVDMIPSTNVTNLGYVYLSCVARTVWVVTVVFAKHLWTGIIYRHHDTILLYS